MGDVASITRVRNYHLPVEVVLSIARAPHGYADISADLTDTDTGFFSWIIFMDISEALRFHGYGYGYGYHIHGYPRI